MSYRPTISVYVNGKIADIGYYRNWDNWSIFVECLTISTLFHDCKSVEEYRERVYGTQKIGIIISPEIWDNTDENLKTLEWHSEDPFIVDLTHKCIYRNYGVLTKEEIERIPASDEVISFQQYKEQTLRRRSVFQYTFSTKEERLKEDYEQHINKWYRDYYMKLKHSWSIYPHQYKQEKYIYPIMGYHRISFDKLDMDEVKELIYEKYQRHVSSRNLELLEKSMKSRGSSEETNDKHTCDIIFN